MTLNPLPAPTGCPVWCTAEHGLYAGEDDQLHTGAPLFLTDMVTALLCATVDPSTGVTDGPYLLVDGEEWTPDHARSVGRALIALADASAQPTPRPGPRLLTQ